MRVLSFILVAGTLLLALPPARAQQFEGEWAWKPLYEHGGVIFKYIHYHKADNQNHGVVVLLINTNDYAVEYQFKIVFRSGGEEAVRATSGRLEAGQRKTGAGDDLFWIPFLDGRIIRSIGLRGYKVAPQA